jgi:hypothetical protein
LVSICKSIAEQLDSLEIDLDTIKILFSAMEANLILSDFGSKIFLQLSKNKQIHPEWVPLIREWNITLKEKTLSVDIKEKQDIGIKQLQTFNVVPTVDNKKLPEIFQTYFGFSVQEQTNWKAQLGTILKMISKEHSQSICFMVSYTNRYQSYFDLSNIVGKPAYADYKGVNSKMIDDMEILKREPSTQGTKNMITLHAIFIFISKRIQLRLISRNISSAKPFLNLSMLIIKYLKRASLKLFQKKKLQAFLTNKPSIITLIVKKNKKRLLLCYSMLS